MSKDIKLSPEDLQIIADASYFGNEVSSILCEAINKISKIANDNSVHVQKDWEWKLQFITQTFYGSVKSAQNYNNNLIKQMIYHTRQANGDEKIMELLQKQVEVLCRLSIAKSVSPDLEKLFNDYTGSSFKPYNKEDNDKSKSKQVVELELHNTKMIDYAKKLTQQVENNKIAYKENHSIEDFTEANQPI